MPLEMRADLTPRRAQGIGGSPLTWVISVCVAHLVLQLLLFSLERGVSWDEAIYLSQVTRDAPSLPFAASRARGITLLVWPIAFAGLPISATRLYLATASSAALVVAFGSWIPHLGRWAALAAASFALGWVALLYGSEVMPNLWVAIALIAAVAAFGTRAPSRRTLLVGTGALAIASLIRPWDALIVALVVAAWTIATGHARRSSIVVAGAMVGTLPWIFELATRSDGPVAALREATSLGHVTLTNPAATFRHQLALADGPILGPAAALETPLGGVVWWGAIAGLAVIGSLERGPHAAPVRLATTAGVVVLASYLVSVDAFAPRFLLPVYALLAPAMAEGAKRVWAGSRSVGRGGLVALLVGLACWHLLTAGAIETRLVASRAVFERAGEAVRRHAQDGCRVASEAGFPQVAFASRCEGQPLAGPDSLAWVLEANSSFVIVREPADLDPRVVTVFASIASVEAPSGDRWSVVEVGPAAG